MYSLLSLTSSNLPKRSNNSSHLRHSRTSSAGLHLHTKDIRSSSLDTLARRLGSFSNHHVSMRLVARMASLDSPGLFLGME